MADELYVQAEDLKRLASDINQQYGNIKQPPGMDAASGIAPNFNESEALIRTLRQSGMSATSYYTGVPGTVGYNSSLMTAAANQYKDIDANGARDYERIMRRLRDRIPAGPATGTGGGPPHIAPSAAPVTHAADPGNSGTGPTTVDPSETLGGTRNDPMGAGGADRPADDGTD